ncbi:MAG TPA: long-chain-fatty-acid--CoA ligase [Steroidobacteraceae bacterium]|nr:long-chain-fatty-acid--CoA ligase [Steroidobacteraceae bacterium]
MSNAGRSAAAGRIVSGCPSTMGDDYQLNLTTLIRHAARTHAEQQILYRTAGAWERYTYRDCYERVCRAANALRSLGVSPGDRVGVLDFNSRRYFELYYAIPGLGAILLQLNLRLAPEELGYIVGHSRATFICVDETLLALAEALAPHAPGVKGWIVMTDKAEIRTTLAPLHHHEDLLAAASPNMDWPIIDERSAYSACYTTGTTGRPKGVYYSHRAMYLHSLSLAVRIGLTSRDRVMLISPLFHAQGWGLPQAATLQANKLLLPGRFTTENIAPLVEALIAEGVTVTGAVPTILFAMLHHIETLAVTPELSRLRVLCGGSEPPLSLMKRLRELTGAEVIQAYGATETGPCASLSLPKPSLAERLGPEELWDVRCTQGLPGAGVDIKVLGPDDRELPHDGKSVGEICLRGPFITSSYYDMPESANRFIDGYWRSGDVGSIDADGYINLTDRLKDVIKSGGEWISSIDMENALAGHPAVLEAVVVGIPHPTWQERPLALVVRRPGLAVTQEQLHEHLLGTFGKWQLPDQILFVTSIPKTSVGKLDKKVIRAEYAGLYARGSGA